MWIMLYWSDKEDSVTLIDVNRLPPEGAFFFHRNYGGKIATQSKVQKILTSAYGNARCTYMKWHKYWYTGDYITGLDQKIVQSDK